MFLTGHIDFRQTLFPRIRTDCLNNKHTCELITTLENIKKSIIGMSAFSLLRPRINTILSFILWSKIIPFLNLMCSRRYVW